MSTKLNNNLTIVKNRNIFDTIMSIVNAGVNGKTIIVPHVCNNINAFGAGFAGQVAINFPSVKANFHLLGSKARLGHVQFVNTYTEQNYKYSLYFANMIAQNKTISPKNPRPLNYGALVNCMYQIRSFIKEYEKNNEEIKVEIHSPRFGCGLAGGDWGFVSNLIDDIWGDIPVFVYLLNNKN